MKNRLVAPSLTLVLWTSSAFGQDIELVGARPKYFKFLHPQTKELFLGYSYGGPKGGKIELTSCINRSERITVDYDPDTSDQGPCEGSSAGTAQYVYLVPGIVSGTTSETVTIRIGSGSGEHVLTMSRAAISPSVFKEVSAGQREVFLSPTGGLVGKSENAVQETLKRAIASNDNPVKLGAEISRSFSLEKRF